MDQPKDISLCNSDLKLYMFAVGAFIGFVIIIYLQRTYTINIDINK